ncbi:hypothetical protein ACU5AY_11125 [Rhizobium sp. PAMB 3174]
MFDYSAFGIPSHKAMQLEILAEQIAGLDREKPESFIDLGELLEAAENEAGEAALQPWAEQRCGLDWSEC